MTNIINLLETLAIDAKFSNDSTATLTEQLQQLELTDELTAEQQQAIINGDARLLEQLLNISPIKCQIIIEDVPGEEEPQEDDKPEKEAEISQVI